MEQAALFNVDTVTPQKVATTSISYIPHFVPSWKSPRDASCVCSRTFGDFLRTSGICEFLSEITPTSFRTDLALLEKCIPLGMELHQVDRSHAGRQA